VSGSSAKMLADKSAKCHRCVGIRKDFESFLPIYFDHKYLSRSEEVFYPRFAIESRKELFRRDKRISWPSEYELAGGRVS